MRDFQVYVEDIVDAIDSIEEGTSLFLKDGALKT